MRHTYGIMDEGKILLYKPQLFLKHKDLLLFPSTEFDKWFNDIKEYIDALYQIDAWEMGEGNSISITELNLAMSIINNITEELEHLFDSKKTSDSPYHYLSTLDKKYKRQISAITSDMRRIDMRIPVINEEMKYKNMMEIVDEANRYFKCSTKKFKIPKDKQNKKEGH